MDNLQIAQEINNRIGNSPIPFDSVYSIALEIYQELGGEERQFDSVYSILLETLNVLDSGISAMVIDDSSISLSKTWSSSKISSELANAGFQVEIVTELPSVGDPHTIYFILKQDSSTGDTYDEWMYIDGNWEKVGNTQIDLSDYATLNDISTFITLDDTSIYATKTYVDASLNLKADKSYVDTSLALKQDVLSASTGIIIDASNNIYTNALVPTTGWNYATKYIDDDTNLEGTNVATGNYSNWAEGSKTTATSLYGGNHAEGYNTSATGQYAAHSEGYFTEASGMGAHAEGHGASSRHNVASGMGAHAEGIKTVASGMGAHAEGYGGTDFPNVASGMGSHAEGTGTTAQNQNEHAEGANNLSHKASDTFGNAGNTLHSIGDSDLMNVKHNAFEIMQNADMYIKGVGGYQGTDTKVQNASIMTVQEVINSKADAYQTATTADIEALFA